ncbi:MAG TPA: hypothetical protein VH880_03065 [Anaeromyxobacteraceae bacterium]
MRAVRMAALARRLAERKRVEQEIERLARELEPEAVPPRGPGRIRALVARVFASRRRATRVARPRPAKA